MWCVNGWVCVNHTIIIICLMKPLRSRSSETNVCLTFSCLCVSRVSHSLNSFQKKRKPYEIPHLIVPQTLHRNAGCVSP